MWAETVLVIAIVLALAVSFSGVIRRLDILVRHATRVMAFVLALGGVAVRGIVVIILWTRGRGGARSGWDGCRFSGNDPSAGHSGRR